MGYTLGPPRGPGLSWHVPHPDSSPGGGVPSRGHPELGSSWEQTLSHGGRGQRDPALNLGPPGTEQSRALSMPVLEAAENQEAGQGRACGGQRLRNPPASRLNDGQCRRALWRPRFPPSGIWALACTPLPCHLLLLSLCLTYWSCWPLPAPTSMIAVGR